MCWSVPWPGALEDEGLTRVPSAVCDCAHGGRVVKEASIAGLFRSRGISGSDLAYKSIFLRNGGVGSRESFEWTLDKTRSQVQCIFFKMYHTSSFYPISQLHN